MESEVKPDPLPALPQNPTNFSRILGEVPLQRRRGSVIMTTMSLTIAVDLGGTHIRVASYNSESITPVAHFRTRTNAREPGVFDRLVQAIENVWDAKATSIGVASPGPLDPYTGTILATPNIPEWQNFPLASKLSEHFGVPVHIDNDANMAGFGEWTFGAGKGHHNLVYLTISTGVGGGVICNDTLLQGFHGLGAELGHMIVDPNGPPCGCGKHGHVEAFSSGTAIARYAAEQIQAGQKSPLRFDDAQRELSQGQLTAKQLADAALQGDPLAISAFARAGHYLGIAVANYLAIFDPSIVIFGGGVSQVGDLLFKPFEESLREHTFHPHYLDDLVIAKAALGDDVGLLGALAWARYKRTRAE
ncbi:MAG: ROK family protein [Anaerolineales bacterium]|nr:ROK family protein [Anaerolineales bacterium]